MSRTRLAAGVSVRPAFAALVLAVSVLSVLGSAAPAAAEPRPLNEAAGDLLLARQKLAAAERDLARAAELLRPYGIAP